MAADDAPFAGGRAVDRERAARDPCARASTGSRARSRRSSDAAPSPVDRLAARVRDRARYGPPAISSRSARPPRGCAPAVRAAAPARERAQRVEPGARPSSGTRPSRPSRAHDAAVRIPGQAPRRSRRSLARLSRARPSLRARACRSSSRARCPRSWCPAPARRRSVARDLMAQRPRRESGRLDAERERRRRAQAHAELAARVRLRAGRCHRDLRALGARDHERARDRLAVRAADRPRGHGRAAGTRRDARGEGQGRRGRGGRDAVAGGKRDGEDQHQGPDALPWGQRDLGRDECSFRHRDGREPFEPPFLVARTSTAPTGTFSSVFPRASVGIRRPMPRRRPATRATVGGAAHGCAVGPSTVTTTRPRGGG
jgi:hypothetical protein